MNESLSAKEIVTKELDSLRGRLCTVIESASLPKKQEKALITLIKQLSYQNQAVIVEIIEALDKDQKFVYLRQKVQQVND